jgi:tetratricopeptide (TPR) repeat protein/tRNA A-37 threonylcarbamoyl transferase component Bud32/TolB-like protein
METKGRQTPASPERVSLSAWELVDALFDSALDQPSSSRIEWTRANAPSQAIANEVIALLSAANRQGVLDTEIPAQLVVPESADEIMQRLSDALDGRYRIDAVLGQGGAATVFLAHERKHDRLVVLKVLRPEVARWIGAERFLAEIQILARLSHPHILALIDSGNAGGLLYYVMPYVGGETLRERLARGAVPADEALPLLRDTAAALAHAHEQHLVHRDLKPDNILIVAGHAFLMDFGIAKLGPEIRSAGETTEGLAIGTPAYMAPEQAAATGVDVRADVYSWAVVAAEALVGRVGRSNELSKAASRELRTLIEECLEHDPEKRPRDGRELLGRVDALSDPRARGIRRVTWMVGAVVAVAVLGGALYRFTRSHSLARDAGPVMVAPLTNETGDSALAVWGRMAGDWLTQGLHQMGNVAVVPWPVALQASTTLHGHVTEDPVRALSAETGAQTVVTGAYYLNGPTVRFQVQVTDVKNGVVLTALPAIEVPRDSIRSGIQQLRDRLMAVFAIRADERFAGLPGIVEEPPTYDAYRAFERGVERFNALDYAAASDAFMESWRRDTTFAIPLVYAANAYMNRSQYARAESLVTAMRTRSMRVNPYYELTLRYIEAMLAGDAPKALEMARQATAAAPGGRAQYNLSSIAMSIGRIDEALTTLNHIDPDKGAMKGWAPYWFVLTHAQHLKGDFSLELATTRELRRRHPDSRAGWVHEARALAALGNTVAADSLITLAASLPPDTYWSQAAMLVIIGEELDAHRHPGAQRYYDQAITWLANQLARDPSNRAHRYWMGSVQLDRGAPEDAAPYFESLARDFPDDVQFRGLWGVSAALVGDTALARQRLGPAPAYRRGEYLSYLARYAAIAGDTERSVALWSESLGSGLSGLVWLHASARRELASVLNDGRFRRLGIIPGEKPAGR